MIHDAHRNFHKKLLHASAPSLAALSLSYSTYYNISDYCGKFDFVHGNRFFAYIACIESIHAHYKSQVGIQLDSLCSMGNRIQLDNNRNKTPMFRHNFCHIFQVDIVFFCHLHKSTLGHTFFLHFLSYYQSRFHLLYTIPFQLELVHQSLEGNIQMVILPEFDVVMDGVL